MRTVYEVSNVNGSSLFESEALARQAAASRPKDWGSAVGLPAAGVRAVRLFESVEEWHRYMGHGPDWRA